MKEIQLTQNQVALVDDEDYEYLNQWKWYTRYSKSTKSYYALRRDYLENKTVLMHRDILKARKGTIVDHIDHDTLNNQKYNLRFVSNSESMINRRKQKNNTSGYKGVSWHKQHRKWNARITLNKKVINIGLFNSATQAYEAYIKKSKELHADFACIEAKDIENVIS